MSGMKPIDLELTFIGLKEGDSAFCLGIGCYPWNWAGYKGKNSAEGKRSAVAQLHEYSGKLLLLPV